MLRIDFGFFSVRGVWRAVLGVFVVCVLVVSGLVWGGPDAAGKIKVDPRSPISTESLEGLEMWRLSHFYRNAWWISNYCGTYSYDAAWIGYVGGRNVCMIYKASGNEFWLVKGDLFIPLSEDIFFLSLRVGETSFLYFGCDDDVLRCANPIVMPLVSSLDIAGDDNLVIETVVAESADVGPEGIYPLRSRVSKLPNFPWRSKLCHVTDTRRYSDNCENENAEANNFEISISVSSRSKSFDLTWFGDDETNVRSFPRTVYVRDFGTVEPEPFYCWQKGNDSGQDSADQKYTCYGKHILGLDGNAIILGSSREAVLDNNSDSSDDILEIPEPAVRVVAMEITQGVQNWKNELTLVKDRPTAVRVFVETVRDTFLSREITAKLKLAIVGGQRNIRPDTIEPIFPDKLVEVASDVASRREFFDSSINFKLEKSWTNLEKGEELLIEVVFDDRTICGENSDTTACEKRVSFTEVHAPEVYIVPIPSNINDENSAPSNEELREQFDRIMSVLPLANIQYRQLDTNNSDLYDKIIGLIRTRVDEETQKQKSKETDQQEGSERRRDPYITFVYESILMYIADKDYAPIDSGKFYIGIIAGNNRPGSAGVGGPDFAQPAVWFINEDQVLNEELNQRLGGFRNAGSHEFAHSLDEEHAVDSDRKVICSGENSEVDKDGRLYEFIYSLPRNNSFRDVPVATLGPLVDAERIGESSDKITNFEEVWGLDLRFIEESNPMDRLVILDPREVFALMSYCIDRHASNQGLWIDSVYHERIVSTLKSKFSALDSLEYADDEMFSRVHSLSFFGTLKLSENSEIQKVELFPLFLRNRQAKMPEHEGNYTLEFRDGSGNTVRNVPFQTFSPKSGTISLNNELESSRKAYFLFQVENPPEYDELVFLHEGEEIASFKASANSPGISILSGPSSGQIISSDSFLNLSWASDDADNDDLVHNVYYSVDGGLNYELLRLRTEETSLSIDAGNLKGSDHARVGISVSDGIRSSFVETPVFSVEKHRPDVYIETSTSDLEFTMPETVSLQAWGSDKDDNGPLSYSWQSNIDGDLGNEDTLSLPSRNFASGSHTITVTVTDSDGMSTTTSVDIQINQEPVIPEIVDDIAFTQVDRLTTIDVLANDIDLANNLDLSTLAIDNLPVHGYAEVSTLLPEHIFIEYISSVQGSDNFSYSICDTAGQCYTGEVTVFVALPDCTVMGTDEDDVLTGTSGDDVICGLGGNDTIDARGGDDIIHGGQGNDTIYARVGDDLIYGGDGDDLILAHRGDDIIRGGKGNDVIYAGGGNDGAAGEDGADKLYGEADNDNLFGDEGPDTIHGGRGDDTIYGGNGDDTIRGNAGADKIYPGTGANTILGTTPLDTVLE